MIKMFLLTSLIFGALVIAPPVRAQTAPVLDCDTLPALAGNRRDRPVGSDHENCILWPQSTPVLQIYRPVPSSHNQSNAERILQEIKTAVETSLRTYRRNGFLNTRSQPPIHLWLVKSEGGSDADTNASSSSSPCVINVYLPSISGTYNGDEFHQILAHEIFHCVQVAQLNQPYIPSTYWWMEGTAEWASAIVYPATNTEYGSTAYYHQHELLFDQCDPGHTGRCGESLGIYATALFFQDMANQQGNAAVFDLLQRMPTFSRQDAQQQAFSDAPGIDDVFEKFTHDYIDGKISDPGGGYMRQPKAIMSQTFEIDSPQSITIQGTPLMIYAYKIKFAKGKTYTLKGLKNQDRFRLSWRMGDKPWQSGDRSDPLEVKAGCSEQTGIIAVTSAENVPESKQFTLHIQVIDDNAECPCACASPVPACVTGQWKSTEAPQLDLFVNAVNGLNKTGKDSVAFENGSANVDNANLTLNIDRSGDFTHSTSIDYHGGGEVSGQKITMKGSIRGTAQGQACLTADRQLCMQYSATTPPTAMQITAMGMTFPIPSAGGAYTGDITMPYTCRANTLILKPTMPGNDQYPSTEMSLRFHR